MAEVEGLQGDVKFGRAEGMQLNGEIIPCWWDHSRRGPSLHTAYADLWRLIGWMGSLPNPGASISLWDHDAFPPFQISPYFRKILRLWKMFKILHFPEKCLDFHPPKFLMTFFSHRPQISISPYFPCFTCFLHTLCCNKAALDWPRCPSLGLVP